MNSDDQRLQLDPGDGLAESRGVFVANLFAVALDTVRLMRADSVRMVVGVALVIPVGSPFVEIAGAGRGFRLPDVALSVVITVLFGAMSLTGKPLSYTATRETRLEPAASVARSHRRITLPVYFGKPALGDVLAPTWVPDKPTVRAGAA